MMLVACDILQYTGTEGVNEIFVDSDSLTLLCLQKLSSLEGGVKRAELGSGVGCPGRKVDD